MTLRWPLGKKIVPVADLGLPDGVDFGLNWPDDLKAVLAVQVVQTPTGAKIVQATNSGFIGRSATLPYSKIREATEGAGNTGVRNTNGYAAIAWGIEVLALTGAPTNVQYRPAFSFDGGTTWYEGASATLTAAGFGFTGIGAVINNPGTGNGILGSSFAAMPLPPLVRLDWLFSAGTAPTVQHRIWESLL